MSTQNQTPDATATPRTDAIKFTAQLWDPEVGEETVVVVFASDYATIEREHAAAKAEIAKLRRALMGGNEVALLVSDLTCQCQELNARAEAALDAARTALAHINCTAPFLPGPIRAKLIRASGQG